MPRITLPEAYRVTLITVAKGQEPKIGTVYYHDNSEEAQQWVNNYNAVNIPDPRPDEYTMAFYEGLVR